MAKQASKLKSTSNPTAIVGLELDVDRLVGAYAAKDAADATIADIRATLDPLAREERHALESQGVTTKHVAFKGTGKDARYTFPDRYKALPAGVANDLRALVGAPIFGGLFEKRTAYAMRDDALPALLALLGDQVAEYFQVTENLCPVDGFGAKRAAVRGTLDAAANAGLDHVIEQISSAPSLSVK